PARLDLGGPELRRTLALTHADFSRLLGNRHVREDADPDAADALHGAGDRAASRLDLARGDALGFLGLQPELAEVEVRAALGDAGNAPLELLAELSAFWLQHGSSRSALRSLLATIAITVIAVTTAGAAALVGEALVLGHRVVFEDLALEDPD